MLLVIPGRLSRHLAHKISNRLSCGESSVQEYECFLKHGVSGVRKYLLVAINQFALGENISASAVKQVAEFGKSNFRLFPLAICGHYCLVFLYGRRCNIPFEQLRTGRII